MEIGATSPPSYLPTQPAEPRAVRPVAREISGDGGGTVSKGRKDEGKQQSGLPSGAGSLKPAETRKTLESQVANSARTEIENQQAAPSGEAQRVQQQEVVIATGGGIKLDVEDGHRVLKVFDSKDVLIYQLPPKGALTLIKAEESAQRSQVETSA